MASDLATRLCRIMAGEAQKTPVITGKPVTKVAVTGPNPLKLPWLPVLPVKSSNVPNAAIGTVTKAVTEGAPAPACPGPYPDITERTAIAEHAGGVPAPYADGFALLQCQRPFTVTEAQWRQLLDDAGRFFDQWGGMAADWGWTADQLLDVPRDGLPGGMLWELQGERVAAFGPGHARTESGRIIERLQLQGTRYVAIP